MGAKEHRYVHPFAPDVLAREKLDNLESASGSMRPFIQTCLKLPILFRVGAHRIAVNECRICNGKAPDDQPDRYPLVLRGGKLYCEAGNHTITIREMLRVYAETEKEATAMLMRLGQMGNPPLIRAYVYETKTERVVGEHPNVVQELYVKDGEPVRGVIIECSHLDMAKQLAGQPGSRKKMNFCEEVSLREDGSLVDVRWHNGYLTEFERRLLRKQQERNEQERKEKKARELRVFQRQQM